MSSEEENSYTFILVLLCIQLLIIHSEKSGAPLITKGSIPIYQRTNWILQVCLNSDNMTQNLANHSFFKSEKDWSQLLSAVPDEQINGVSNPGSPT